MGCECGGVVCLGGFCALGEVVARGVVWLPHPQTQSLMLALGHSECLEITSTYEEDREIKLQTITYYFYLITLRLSTVPDVAICTFYTIFSDRQNVLNESSIILNSLYLHMRYNMAQSD